jgi:acyl-CoA synthetase (NDP forming)
VSQSGALAFTTFFERASDEDVHFAAIASTGNEVDLTVADYVAYLTDRPDVDVICAYIEGIDEPERFMRAAERATREGTPVLTVKIGRSDIAEAATLSHTGSVTGNDAVWEAAFEQTGIQRVPDIPDLLGRAQAHTAFDPPESARICVASTSGGLASLLADLSDERGLELPSLPNETEQRLLEMDELLTFGELHNPADIRGYGAEALPAIAEELFAADVYDAYVFAIGLSAVDERADRIADDLATIAEAAPAPVFVLWTGRKEAETTETLPYERFRRDNPLFYDPARCMDAVASLVEAGEAQHRRQAVSSLDGDTLSTAEPSSPVPSDGRVLSWSEASTLLEEYGVETVATELATEPAEAAAHAQELGFPVAMKVESSDLPHRSDADAVRLDIHTTAAAEEAYREIVTSANEFDPSATVDGVLVQRQVDTGVEALVGVTHDAVFGPVVTIAPGGTLVEVMDDGVVRIPPTTAADVDAAIDETALGELLAGQRGSAPADRDAFVDLVQRVGRLALEHPIEEMDLNPVVVGSEGAHAVDALVRTASDAEE